MWKWSSIRPRFLEGVLIALLVGFGAWGASVYGVGTTPLTSTPSTLGIRTECGPVIMLMGRTLYRFGRDVNV